MKRLASFILCIILITCYSCVAEPDPEQDIPLSIYQFGGFYIGLPSEWTGLDLGDDLYAISADTANGEKYLIFITAKEIDGSLISKLGLNTFFGMYYDKLHLSSLTRETVEFYGTVADVFFGQDETNEQTGGFILIYKDFFLYVTMNRAEDGDLDMQVVHDILNATAPCDALSIDELMEQKKQ